MELLKWVVAGLLLGLLARAAFAVETKEDKDLRECNAQAEAVANEAVKKTPMQHPDDVTEIKRRAERDERNKCLRARSYATGPIRAK